MREASEGFKQKSDLLRLRMRMWTTSRLQGDRLMATLIVPGPGTKHFSFPNTPLPHHSHEGAGHVSNRERDLLHRQLHKSQRWRSAEAFRTAAGMSRSPTLPGPEGSGRRKKMDHPRRGMQLHAPTLTSSPSRTRPAICPGLFQAFFHF